MIARYLAIEAVLRHTGPGDLVLSTTGMISREVFVANDRPGNFYMLGSMGLVSSLGLGLCLLNPGQRVIVIEGDGSSLMNLGVLPLIASEGPRNLLHVILDNEAYESTGGQPSIGSRVDLAEIARGSGYASVARVTGMESLDRALVAAMAKDGPALVHVKAAIAPVEGTPRVSHSPEYIRDRFRSMVSPRQA